MINIIDTQDIIKSKLKDVIKQPIVVKMHTPFLEIANCVELCYEFKRKIPKLLGIKDIKDLLIITKSFKFYEEECAKTPSMSAYCLEFKKRSYLVYRYIADRVWIEPSSLFGGITLYPCYDKIYREPAFLVSKNAHKVFDDYIQIIKHLEPYRKKVDGKEMLDLIATYYVSPSIYTFYKMLGAVTIVDLLNMSKDKKTFYRYAVKSHVMNYYNKKQAEYIWEITKALKKLFTYTNRR